MKKFNINQYVYIQITEHGWKHLQKTVGRSYIDACIEINKKEINGEVWYKLQCHQAFELLPIDFGGKTLFNTNIMFDSESLSDALA